MNLTTAFGNRLTHAIETKKSCVVVGLDPQLQLFPSNLTRPLENASGEDWFACASEIVLDFGRQIVDAVADLAPAIKLQAAFYERLGPTGLEAMRRTIKHARQCNLIVILDAKRNDIESTAEAYAAAYLGSEDGLGGCPFDVDALTINPYLGSDGVLPFVRAAAPHGKGVFVLVRTSNPSAAEFQDLDVARGAGTEPLCYAIARKVHEWGTETTSLSQYSSVGAVVGATFPQEAITLRRLMPRSFFLVPGVGAQGADTSQLSVFFDETGSGALISASRSVIYAYQRTPNRNKPFADAARDAALRLRDTIERARSQAANAKKT